MPITSITILPHIPLSVFHQSHPPSYNLSQDNQKPWQVSTVARLCDFQEQQPQCFSCGLGAHHTNRCKVSEEDRYPRMLTLLSLPDFQTIARKLAPLPVYALRRLFLSKAEPSKLIIYSCRAIHAILLQHLWWESAKPRRAIRTHLSAFK